MWRRISFAILIISILITISGTVIQAQSPETVSMSGKVAFFNDSDYSGMRIKTTSSNPEWLLEIDLQPIAYSYDNALANHTYNMEGDFVLGASGVPVISGTVSGWWNSSGPGEITLVSSDNSYSLDMSFTIQENGTITSEVRGTWPEYPLAEEQSSTDNLFLLTRTIAILAYFLLFISICFKLMSHNRLIKTYTQFWYKYSIQNITGIIMIILAVLHPIILVTDHYANYGIQEIIIPGITNYNTLWVGLGITGLYLILGIYLAGVFKRHYGHRTLVILDILSFAAYILILIHSIRSGSDNSLPWIQTMYFISGSAAILLAFWSGVMACKDHRHNNHTSGYISNNHFPL